MRCGAVRCAFAGRSLRICLVRLKCSATRIWNLKFIVNVSLDSGPRRDLISGFACFRTNLSRPAPSRGQVTSCSSSTKARRQPGGAHLGRCFHMNRARMTQPDSERAAVMQLPWRPAGPAARGPAMAQGAECSTPLHRCVRACETRCWPLAGRPGVAAPGCEFASPGGGPR